MSLKIVQEQPPIIDEIGKVFRLPEGVVFTFGNVLYNPSGNLIDPPLMVHETVHSVQQGKDPKGWWTRYLKDPAFRLSQEISAYRAQYQEAKKYIKDRNRLNNYCRSLAKDVSSEQYGKIVSFSAAFEAIRKCKM